MKIFFSLLIIATALVHLGAATTDQVDLFKECYKLLTENNCANYQDAYARRIQVAARCGDITLANRLATGCTKNQQGVRCAAAFAYHSDFLRLFTDCATSFPQSANCTNSCKNSLMYLRNELGCCINSYYNDTTPGGSADYSFATFLFSEYFWSSKCGLPDISNCDDQYKLDVNIALNATCGSPADGLNQYLAYDCSPSEYELQKNIWENQLPSRCHNILESFRSNQCSRNRNGTYCAAFALTDFTNYITPVSTQCNGRNCSSQCKDTLNAFQNNHGCCINSLYNSTYEVILGFNYPQYSNQDLFRSCDVQVPPAICPVDSTTTASDGGSQTYSFMYLLLLISAISLFGI